MIRRELEDYFHENFSSKEDKKKIEEMVTSEVDEDE
jgi:hypothetical protein